MRQKRAKAYRKLMALYSMTFGFRQPYQVLVDSEMCKAATELKLELVKQIVSVLQGEVKPMITQCCIHELYLQGVTQQASVDLAKTFERRKCNHREPIAGDECISSVVGDSNKHRYVIATQSQDLRVRLRSVPAAPIVHVNRSVMVLEPPSDITIQTKTRTEEQALYPSAPDLALIGRPLTSAEPAHKKRKGPRGPNPLSVKKKKVNPPVKPKDNAREIVDVQKRAEVGQKRKCQSLESEIEETGEPRPAAGVVTAAVKRRKRRKKLAAKYLGLTAGVSNN